VGEEDSTAVVAAHSMEVAEEGFTGVEASTAEAALLTPADAPSADIVAPATTVVAAAMAGVAEAMAGAGEATVGAADIGDADTDGAGDLDSGGRIGVGDWDGGIRMATATAHGITRPTPTILTRLTRTTVLQAIRRAIWILATATMIPGRQIPTRRPRPTRTDLQGPGGHPHQEAQPTRTIQTATWRPLGCVVLFSPLTRRA
jgi:hypothetical protein